MVQVKDILSNPNFITLVWKDGSATVILRFASVAILAKLV